jgi:hypothetical protein
MFSWYNDINQFFEKKNHAAERAKDYPFPLYAAAPCREKDGTTSHTNGSMGKKKKRLSLSIIRRRSL